MNYIVQEYNRHRRLRQMAYLLSDSMIFAEKSYWMTRYHQNWFENIWAIREVQIVKELFKREFRMSPETFSMIINIVDQPMSRQDTRYREAVPIHKRVAIAIWRLATGNAYRVISKVFGVSMSTVSNVVLEFCTVLSLIVSQHIKFPDTAAETSVMIDLFQITTNCPIPQIVGCLDCTHCKVICPDIVSYSDYFNRKQVYSVNTQAVIGESLKFLDVSTGYPGSAHDSRVLRSSSLFNRAENHEILEQPTVQVMGRGIKPIVLADGAYPQLRWIMKPYARNRNLTPQEVNFNTVLSQSRSVVERGFGLLKTRWRCLYKMLEQNLENVPFVILACCVLHNICQDKNEELSDEDRQFLDQVIQQERRNRNRKRQNNAVLCNDFNEQRDVLTQYLQNINH